MCPISALSSGIYLTFSAVKNALIQGNGGFCSRVAPKFERNHELASPEATVNITSRGAAETGPP